MWLMLTRRHEAIVAELRSALEGTENELTRTQQLAGSLHDQATLHAREYALALEKLQQEVRRLLERLITAEGAAQKADALVAMWETRVNQLNLERDLLMMRVVPGLDLATPHVSTTGSRIIPPDVTFDEDVRPVTETELDGAPGQVYNPAAITDS